MGNRACTFWSLFLVLYFAYGSNMDLVQMSTRCERAATVGTATLAFHKFIINSHGVATVVPDRSSAVLGLLWQISESDERSLDRYEGVESGSYRREYFDVQMPDGKKVKALVYVAADSNPGKPRPGYLERILSAAKECGLPETYLSQLRPWLQ
jgi:cation transport regulator ChaC